MKLLDFSNRQNRDVRIEDVTPEYLQYIEQLRQSDDWYPTYHIAPKHGLLNDPNGLYYHEGKYHIFYQWFPLGPVHGLKHWYHVATEDFQTYEDYGIALAPQNDFDANGCYTGMAWNQKIYYTGIDYQDKEPNVCYCEIENNQLINKQKLFSRNPKLTTSEFRDPFVWEHENQIYMINGGQNLDLKGCITLHVSNDGINFTDLGLVEFNTDNDIYMIECPNYLRMQEKAIMLYSPQGLKAKNKYDFRNVFSVVYTIGEQLSQQNLKFNNTEAIELDKGFDFYAPQIFTGENDKQILIAWLGNSKAEYPSDKNQWAHMLTIPREITVVDNKLVQKPLENLAQLRKAAWTVTEPIHFLTSQSFELELCGAENFEIQLANEVGELISFKGNHDEYCLDREQMSVCYNEQYGLQRYARRQSISEQIKIYIDHSSIEIFCDGGRTVFTSRFFIHDWKYLHVTGTKATGYDLKNLIYEPVMK